MPDLTDDFDPTDVTEPTDASQREVSVKAVEFADLPAAAPASGGSMSQLLKVKFEIEAVLGRTILPIGEILKLGSGSVVELDRTISEPVDLVVQGLTVARGEVVVAGDSFAIRIREVMSPQE
jgi:flagellar motor switch protein FliN/FliY